MRLILWIHINKYDLIAGIAVDTDAKLLHARRHHGGTAKNFGGRDQSSACQSEGDRSGRRPPYGQHWAGQNGTAYNTDPSV